MHIFMMIIEFDKNDFILKQLNGDIGPVSRDHSLYWQKFPANM